MKCTRYLLYNKLMVTVVKKKMLRRKANILLKAITVMINTKKFVRLIHCLIEKMKINT